MTSSDYLTLIDLLNGANYFIPWNGVSLPSNCCPDSCEEEFGGMGQWEDESDEMAAFTPGVVEFLTSADPVGDAANADFEIFVNGLTRWSVMHLSQSEKDSLATELTDVSLTFASQAGADAAAVMAAALAQ